MKILLLLLLCNGLQAKDLSRFSIHAGSGDNPTKVQFIVTDSQGRKTGFESYYYGETGYINVNAFTEIPHSNYYTEYVGNLDPSLAPEPESAIFGMREVIKDTYTIQFIGIDNCKYHVAMSLHDLNGNKVGNSIRYKAYITSGTTQQYSLYIDPTPGAPPPTITKIVTFQILRDDFNVAQKLNQIGDDKFVSSLIRMVNIAEKIYNRCQQIKDDSKKDKRKKLCYRPVIAILELIKKRLEIVNKICDNPNECKSKCKLKDECDEEKAFDNFRKENIKEEGIKEFFSEWDKDEWHKHKKHCKKFVTDEALKIISEDIDWLIKSFSVEKDKLKDKLDKDDVKDLKSEK